MIKKLRSYLKNSTSYTSHIKMISAWYPRRRPTARLLADQQESEEIQSFADRKDMKFHDALKTVYGPKRSEATSQLMSDGSTLMIKMLSCKDGQNTSIAC